MSDHQITDWLLTCVEGEGATLRDIVAYVDYRNHAILTCTELVAGLNQLAQTGKVRREGMLFRFTPGEPQPEENPLFSEAEFVTAVNEYLSKSQ